MIKTLGYNNVANFCMTDKQLYLDTEINAIRFCMSPIDIDQMAQIWISGYCLFYITNNGVSFYRGVNGSGELGIETCSYDSHRLKTIGVDIL